ncbi:alpha/beta hydrolase [Ponticaulis koreensis]|uniref:alpha/beta hydrolase n=1 Tax=Ponticaulis koreensis TaxID=1123045 RepID=UPI0003B461EB|nr:alpha/beta hydrolase [Ponticaulis koreensis]
MEDLREEDFEIVAQSYRVISDADAFDGLVAAWQDRLDKAGGENSSSGISGFANQLFQHIEKADKLASEVPTALANDPVDRLLADGSFATLVVSAEQYVLGTNEQWTTRFGHNQGQKIGEDWLAADSVETFRTVLRNLKNRGNLQHGMVRICTADMDERIAEIFPVEPRNGRDVHAIAIRVLDPEWTPSVRNGIIEAFGLTDAEAEVCQALFRLRDTTAIAEERNTSARTVRLQLASVFQKTRASSQVDLVRLLSLICVRMTKKDETSIPVWRDPYGRERVFKTPSGRKLAYSWLGAKDGVPVILLHGHSVGITLSEEADRYYREIGVRLITFSRPGFGNSEARYDMPVIDDFIEAINDLHTHLNVGKLYFVAHTFTGMGVARFGTLYPEKVGGLISVGGFFPMYDKSRRRHLPFIHNTFLDLVEKAPWAARMLARAGQRIMYEKGLDWYLTRAYGHSKADQQIMNHPVYRALLRNACAHGISQGPESFIREFEFAHYDGFPEFSRFQKPVRLIVGENDHQMIPERIKEFMDVHPATHLTIVPDCGELVVYKGWREIAEMVRDLVPEARST